jgi:hypothetical protein
MLLFKRTTNPKRQADIATFRNGSTSKSTDLPIFRHPVRLSSGITDHHGNIRRGVSIHHPDLVRWLPIRRPKISGDHISRHPQDARSIEYENKLAHSSGEETLTDESVDGFREAQTNICHFDNIK